MQVRAARAAGARHPEQRGSASATGDGSGLGVLFMALSALAFSVMALQVKLLGRRLPSQEIVLARGVVTVILSYALLRRGAISPWGKRRGLLWLRGLLGFGGLSCFYFALTRLSLADATVIHFAHPIFTALIAARLLAERIGAAHVAGLGAGLLGVALVARPPLLTAGGAATADPLGVAAALLGAALSASAYVTVRALRRSEHPLVIVFYFPVVTVPAALPAVLEGGVWPRGAEWVLLLGVGASTQVAQVLLTHGLRRLPAGRATTVGYLQILFAMLWGALLLAEVPDRWGIAGALCVLASTLLAARGGGRGGRRRRGAGRPRAPAAHEAAPRVIAHSPPGP